MCDLLLIVHSALTASGHTSASETSSRTSAAEPWLQRWAAAVASRSSTVASSPAAASKSFNAAIAALTAASAVPSAMSLLQPRRPRFRATLYSLKRCLMLQSSVRQLHAVQSHSQHLWMRTVHQHWQHVAHLRCRVVRMAGGRAVDGAAAALRAAPSARSRSGMPRSAARSWATCEQSMN
jgi:hypothetical protein